MQQEILKDFVFIMTRPIIIECWVTLVKREVGSDFSGHKAFGKESTLRYKNTIKKCKNLLDRSSKRCGYVVTVVSDKGYPGRYVNPTDLPYV